MKSIGRKLAWQIALILTVVMAGTGVLSIVQQRKNSEVSLRAKMDRTQHLLRFILSEPIFNVDMTLIESISESYLVDPDILAIKIFDPQTIFTMYAKTPDGQDILDLTTTPSKMPVYNNIEVRRANILHEDKQLARLEIVFSRRAIIQQTEQTIVVVVVGLLLIITTETLAVLFLMYRHITTPLLKVVDAAKHIAEGHINFSLQTTHSRNEIGILSMTFERMVSYLQHMAATAAQIARGDVHQNIRPRSQQDALGQAFVNMTAYLQDIAATATAVANGDFRHTIQPMSESDVLGKAFANMAGLRQAIDEIMQGVTQLHAASEQLREISVNIATETEEVSQQTDIISSSSEQISENVSAVAASVEDISSSLNGISRNTEQVAQVSDKAVDTITTASTTITDLEARSQEISAVIDVITSIAQQTNLLALNATIEAARAGEFGKGFTVVAKEIKNLSQETTASAEDIIQKLQNIRTGSQYAKEEITTASNIIGQIHEFSNATASGIEQQNVTTKEIAQRMNDVAHGSKDIARVIAEVAEAIRRTSEGSTQVQVSAEQLARLAKRLQQSVARFKV